MLLILGALILALPAQGHICILHPRQRGDMDISTPGSHTCFRHAPPCGGEEAASPRLTLRGGRTEVLKWQQNLNHYSVGYPGYMDVAIGTYNGSDPEDFTMLAAIGDHNEHAQSHQQNYTITVVLPNVACEHCVLRMRYVPHKPGETPFIQCSDVVVIKSETPLDGPASLSPLSQRLLTRPARRALAYITSRGSSVADSSQKMYGFAYNIMKPDSSRLQTVDFTSGRLDSFGDNIEYGYDTGKPYPLGYTQPLLGTFLLDQVLALDLHSDTTVVALHTNNSLDAYFDSLLYLGTHNGSVLRVAKFSSPLQNPISAMHNVGPNQFIYFCFAEDKSKPGSFYFEVYYASEGVNPKLAHRAPDAEDLYVNYQWSEYDADKGLLYVLMGNENAPFRLNARIYTYSVNDGAVKFVSMIVLKVDEYTVQSIHLEKGGSLVSLSPGLAFPTLYPAWTLVRIDPKTGDISPIRQVTPPGLFVNRFGGTIFHAVDSNNTLSYVLHTDAGADVLTRVGVDSQSINFSSMSNFQHLHNMYIA